MAGYDVHASADVSITAKSRKLAPTGLAALAPPGTYIRVAPRSGLALKNVDVAAGVVDPDYRGEIRVVLVNHGSGIFRVTRGMAIAQLILERIVNAKVVQVEQLPETSRGSSGFGSTDRTYLSMDITDEPIQSSTEGGGGGSAAAAAREPSH